MNDIVKRITISREEIERALAEYALSHNMVSDDQVVYCIGFTLTDEGGELDIASACISLKNSESKPA